MSEPVPPTLQPQPWGVRIKCLLLGHDQDYKYPDPLKWKCTRCWKKGRDMNDIFPPEAMA